MKFCVKKTGSVSERIGYLTGFLKFPGTEIDTPTSALFTQGGSVVHLTAEVLSKVFPKPKLLWLPLSNSAQLEAGVRAQGEGVAKFAGVSNHVTCCTFHSTEHLSPTGHFEQDKVPLWTKNGKKLVNADRYMDVMEAFKPDIILAIADGRIPLIEASKRLSKAVERTCNMLDTCVKRYKVSKTLQGSSLIGVIVSAGHKRSSKECMKHILKYAESLDGVALAGLTDGTEDSLNIPVEDLHETFKRISEYMPNQCVRFVEGAWNPAVIMTAIEQGWDVFDGSYPVKLTNLGYGLVLNFDVMRKSDEFCILDLIDERYKDDFRPVVEGCECLSCKKHTRAYIRHLLHTREMLAKVLLSIHNLHNFDQMFYHARQHIASNTFQLYKRHIINQYNEYRITQETGKPETEVQVNCLIQNGIQEKEDHSQIKKKIRVSSNIPVHNNVGS